MTHRCTGVWKTRTDVIVGRLFEGDDTRFRIELEHGLMKVDEEIVPLVMPVPGSDRTLKMAQDGALAIVDNRYGPDYKFTSWDYPEGQRPPEE